nr:7-deoxyloganetic acid glucosyltransferase [Uncaria rhynchophylla]
MDQLNTAAPATAVAEEPLPPPHVLIFPLPLQGHVNSMLKLAELCCISGLHVTVLLSDYNHGRLLRHANVKSRFSRGIPVQKSVGFTDRLSKKTGTEEDEVKRRPVTCLIMDGVLSFAAIVSEEMGIPFIYFRTVGACSFWANFSIQEVIDADQVPLRGKGEDKVSYRNKKEMDLLVTSVAGMEGFLRRRDLPAFFRVDDVNDPGFQTIKTETRRSIKARALILNTFEDLEGPILNQIRKHIPTLYSIGPLHAHLKARFAAKQSATEQSMSHSGSFWDEDRSCVEWLNSQPHKSVIYVSFGSVTIMTRDELLEFWYGLVNSGQRFLWVMRPDSITGKDGESQIPVELEEGTKARGYMVGWAPQEEVLAHPAIGGFLTHSGWNSTLESIFAGVPMICWPYFADQTINSRFVGEVWKLGLDMKDTCDRATVQNMVRDLMEVRKDEFLKKADHMANLARKAINDGGSSYCNLDSLIEFIRSMIM